MTEKTTNKPDLTIYIEMQIAGGTTDLIPVGAAWKHSKGQGINFRIGQNKFVAFPPRQEQAEPSES